MEIPRIRLPRSRNITTNDSAIVPPSVLLSQRRSYMRNERSHSPVKPVYRLTCRHCSSSVCARGMKAILLADTAVELFSTDTPSHCVHVLDKDYLTRSCRCRIRDVACIRCGNVVGYHVISPCHGCLESGNNGHFWMFHSSACLPVQRLDGEKVMMWNHLPRADLDEEFIMGSQIPYDQLCR